MRFVTLTFGGWDYHSSLERGMKRVLPILDAAVGTFIEDLEGRGLLDSTMVIVMGEFGRTPRMNKTGVPGSDPVPGRDHWGKVMCVLIAGGGIARGQVVGSSNSRGELPKDRPVTAARSDRSTVYHQLGINPSTTFLNRGGQPIKIGSDGEVIRELVGLTRSLFVSAGGRQCQRPLAIFNSTRPAVWVIGRRVFLDSAVASSGENQFGAAWRHASSMSSRRSSRRTVESRTSIHG